MNTGSGIGAEQDDNEHKVDGEMEELINLVSQNELRDKVRNDRRNKN